MKELFSYLAFSFKVKFERLTRDHAVTSLQSFVQNDYFLKSPGKSHKDIEAAKDSRIEYQYVFRGALGGEVRQTKLRYESCVDNDVHLFFRWVDTSHFLVAITIITESCNIAVKMAQARDFLSRQVGRRQELSSCISTSSQLYMRNLRRNDMHLIQLMIPESLRTVGSLANAS